MRDAGYGELVLFYGAGVSDLLFQHGDSELFQPPHDLALRGGAFGFYGRGKIAGVQRVDGSLHIVLATSQSCHL